LRHAAILLACLALCACDQKPDQGPTVHVAADATCATDWTKCADNAQLAREYTDWRRVPGLCRQAAMADPQFADAQWPAHPFADVLPGNVYVTSGKAVALETHAPLVSADSVAHAKFICEYDLKAGKITGLYLMPM
jgi:hypothetical protein